MPTKSAGMEVPTSTQAHGLSYSHSAGAEGRLCIRFVSDGVKTQAKVIQQTPPLRLVRGFQQQGGTSLAHLHNVSGGVLGGDQLHVALDVQTGARAQVTTTGATRVYRHRPALAVAEQRLIFTVASDGLLEYLPDPLIPFSGSRYRQRTIIHLADGAGLFAWDVLSPGREAKGEVFDYDLLELHTKICANGQPILLDQARLEPALRPLTAPSRMGPYRYLATLFVCRVGVQSQVWADLEAALGEMAEQYTVAGEILWGASRLPNHGVMVRGLSRTNRPIHDRLIQFWQAAKQDLYGMPAIPPRKVP